MLKPKHSRLDRIIDIARGAAEVGPGEMENREATRVAYHGYVALIAIESSGDKSPATMLHCHDISTGGIGAIGPEELAAGTRGAVLIQKTNGESVVIGARVVYSNSLGPKGFECGIEFEMDPPAVNLEDFRDEGGELPRVGPKKVA